MFKEIFTESKVVVPGKLTTYTVSIKKTTKGSKYETPYWTVILAPKDKNLETIAFRDVLWYHAKSDGQYGLAMQDYTDGNDNGNSQKSMTAPYLYESDRYLEMLVEIAEGRYYKKDALEDSIEKYSAGTSASKVK